MDYYVDDIFSSISKDLKKTMKQKIKDIYPDMEELRRTFNNEKLYNIISKWYLDTINAICEKHIKRYPLKHFAIGYFHWTSSYPLPMYIYIRYPLYESFFTASKHTLDYLIRDIKNDGLLIKIVDNDNNIYFYLSSIKFSVYKPLDMMSYFEHDHLDCNRIFIYDDIMHKKQFAENLLTSIQHRFNLKDCHIDYKYDTDNNDDVIIISDNINNINIAISIKTQFHLQQIKDIMTDVNNNKSSYDIIMPYCKVQHNININDKTNMNEGMNTDIQEEIIKYIYSARHLWEPLCEDILVEFKKRCERKCRWFVNIIDSLCIDPDVLFNDFYTAFSYFNELNPLSFTNIYSF